MSRLRKSGGYRKLAAFQTATLIYDATVWFCERFLDERRSRTVDQMVQAARSGRQNIAEGSRAAATSSQTELRLVNVARASLEELLLDYEDFLRHRRLPLWHSDSPEAMAVRRVASQLRQKRSDWSDSDLSDQTDQSDSDLSDQTDRFDNDRSNRSDSHPTDHFQTDQMRWSFYSRWLDHDDPAVRANAIICLIHQANFLLDQQIDALEREFINDGGYSEQLATARLQKRAELRSAHNTHPYPTNGPARLNHPLPTASNAERSIGHCDSTAKVTPSVSKIAETTHSHMVPPSCPQCGSLMSLRTARSGSNAGSQFWGCTTYPQCRGTLPV